MTDGKFLSAYESHLHLDSFTLLESTQRNIVFKTSVNSVLPELGRGNFSERFGRGDHQPQPISGEP
jgi:hypothetical protein